MQTNNTGIAMENASSFLKLHDATLLRSRSTMVPGHWTREPVRVTITAASCRTPTSPLLPVSFPGSVPGSAEYLHPQATETNDS